MPDEIDPRLIDAPYYITPENRIALEAFAMIRKRHETPVSSVWAVFWSRAMNGHLQRNQRILAGSGTAAWERGDKRADVCEQ